MKKEDLDKANNIILDINTYQQTICGLNKIIQINPEKEGESVEFEILKEAYFMLPQPYRQDLIIQARLIVKACKNEFENKIKLKEKEFEEL